MENIVRIGTRKSPLALKQVDEVLGLLAGRGVVFPFEIVGMDTPGDHDKVTPISEVDGSDFFTRELDEALLRGEIDCAVHSAKDLPAEIPAGLEIAVVTRSIDPSDALVSRGGAGFAELPSGARVGVSSRRRKDQVLELRPDLRALDIRGTIGERLHKLREGKYDALVIASAALVRLGLEGLISERLDPAFFAPHPMQGRLAVAVRAGDAEMKTIFSKLNEEPVHVRTKKRGQSPFP